MIRDSSYLKIIGLAAISFAATFFNTSSAQSSIQSVAQTQSHSQSQSLKQISPDKNYKYPSVNLKKQKSATENFIIPIEAYNGFAGTYGELRGNHFHCGLDLRTGGVEGKRIYAADDGYVSKISVSAWGFGNMIMITHPSGYKTIYGHLQRFAPVYQELLRKKQYDESEWNQEIEFSPTDFPVKKGDLIAYSGNTGSSGGPHLHFEVRDENGYPVNLQLSDTYKIKDAEKPIIRDIQLVGYVPLDEAYFSFPISLASNETKYVTKKVIKTNSKGKKYTTTTKVPVKDAVSSVTEVPSGFYVAVDAYDALNANSGKLAIYKYEVYIDEDLFFSFEAGNIPYSTGRYIASLLDHRLRLEKGRYYVKTQLDPANELKDRIFALKGGVCTLRDTLEHLVTVIVHDISGNTSTKQFKVRRNIDKFTSIIPSSSYGMLMKWDEKNVFKENDFYLTVPEGSLYSNIFFTTSRYERKDKFSPYYWKIGDKNIPLHKGATLELKCSLPDSLASKAVIAKRSDKGSLSSVGGNYNSLTRSIVGNISSFGNYVVAVDTIAPHVTFKFNEGAKVSSNVLKIAIGDNLSGVENFKVMIDNHWVVAEYDGKTSTLNVPLADAKIVRAKSHTMVVELTDGVGNMCRETRRFYW